VSHDRVALRVGSFNRSILIHLARASGDLDQAGLDVTESLVMSSPSQFETLDAGEYDVVFTSPDNVLAYNFLTDNPLGRSIATTIVVGIDRGLGLSLWTSPSIEQPGDLRDAVLGVDVPASGFAYVAYALLDRAGLSPGDYSIATLGSTPRRAEALMEGRCSVTVLNAGNELRAQSAGCSCIASVTELGPYLGTVLATNATDGDMQAHVRRFADILLNVANEILRGERESDVVEAAVELLGLTEDQARDHYRCLTSPNTGLIGDGAVDREAIETLVKLRQTYSPTKELDTVLPSLDRVVDSRVLK
jgi:ABC-type nitrate/sulfonate/bicarbonate transport system substrate-binding protein